MPGSRYYFRNLAAVEPMPNTEITADTIGAGAYVAAKDTRIAPGNIATRTDQNFSWDDTFTTVYTHSVQWLTPPLQSISLAAQNYTLSIWARTTQVTSLISTAKIRTGIYVWDDATDTKKSTIAFPATDGNVLSTTDTNYIIVRAGNAQSLADGDKIVVEVNYELFNGESPFTINPGACRLNYDGGVVDNDYMELATDTLVEFSAFNYAPHAGL